MRIGGVVSCSLSDFPGRIAAVIFTQGCNWRCPWCHNPSLVEPEKFAPPLDEVNVLRRLACGRGKLDGVVVSGGEPTLQPDLAAFLAQVKGLGFETKLDTNGSRPAVVRTLLERRYVDFVAVDIKAPWSRYAEAAGVEVETEALAETIALLRASGIEHQLRTTRWPGLTSDDEREIAAVAAGSPHVWQECRAVANG
jgi:pyruvate formate lyase activating enzyme